MVRSMTGFGRAEATGTRATVTVEARSVNHRHLDIAIRLPRTLSSLEMDLRRLVQSRLERGRVDLSIQVSPAPGESAQKIRVDEALARQYVTEARALGTALGVEGDVTLAWVLDRPGVARMEEADAADPEAIRPTLWKAVGDALDDLVARRTGEGQALAAVLRELQGELAGTVEQIARRVPEVSARRVERMRERFRALLGETAVDEGRVLTEVAMWADRTDISEELARLRAHLGQVVQVLDKGGAVGRLFDFLIQEMNREVNTIASKADDLDLSQAAIAAKGVLEKMREQVQNLE